MNFSHASSKSGNRHQLPTKGLLGEASGLKFAEIPLKLAPIGLFGVMAEVRC